MGLWVAGLWLVGLSVVGLFVTEVTGGGVDGACRVGVVTGSWVGSVVGATGSGATGSGALVAAGASTV